MDDYYLKAINDKKSLQILELQELILEASLSFYRAKKIHWLSAPVTTGSISSPMGLGSDSLPVKINLDGTDMYLSDSMQFLLEYGCRLFKTGCWYIMPSFRGEDVDERHLKQFFHSEAEIPGTLEDVMNLAEEYIKHLIDKSQEIVGRKKHLEQALKHDFARISFDDAETLLDKEDIIKEDGWRNITSQGEKKLIEHFNGPVWLHHFDEKAVPFYQQRVNGKAKNADLLLGIGETIGCGERLANGSEVRESLKLHHVPEDDYAWYIKMKDKFPLQTSGFGMGIERFLLFILGKTDIRKMQVFRRFNDGKDIV